jgi:hypothetical protein
VDKFVRLKDPTAYLKKYLDLIDKEQTSGYFSGLEKDRSDESESQDKKLIVDLSRQVADTLTANLELRAKLKSTQTELDKCKNQRLLTEDSRKKRAETSQNQEIIRQNLGKCIQILYYFRLEND